MLFKFSTWSKSNKIKNNKKTVKAFLSLNKHVTLNKTDSVEFYTHSIQLVKNNKILEVFFSENVSGDYDINHITSKLLTNYWSSS